MKKSRTTAPAASLLGLSLRRFRRSRSAMTGLAVLAALYLFTIFADFLAPYDYANENRPNSYCPPNLHFVDAAGRFHLRPFVYKRAFRYEWSGEGAERVREKVWYEDRSQRHPMGFFVKGDPHKLLGLIPTQRRLFGVGEAIPDRGEKPPFRVPDGPPRVYLLGANDMGQDILSRILYGGRISMTVGLVGSGITFVLGMLMGGISGYFGGVVDTTVQRFCEMIMMVPGFYLMLALRASMPPDLSSVQVYLFVVAILSFIGWAGFARVVRGIVLSIRNKEYVLAARAIGAPHRRIIIRHILPNTLSYAIIAVTLGIPGYILGESALSLLGLGIQRPHASWGNMLSDAMNIAQIQFHPWVLIPGGFIFIAVMAFNLVGDGLRDAFDPQGLTRRAEGR